jgi:hypothetical protein
MKFSKLNQAVGCLLFALVAPGAEASLVTLSGSGFDVVYDDQLTLSGQSAPSIQGNVIVFTPSQLRVESLNGSGLNSVSSAYSFVITPHDGLFVAGIQVQERGDYVLRGSQSWISLAGLASATAIGSAPLASVSASLVANNTQALTLRDGISHNWSASAFLDMQGLAAFSQEADVLFNLNTSLSASTDASEAGPRRAFIQKKFSGESITLSVATTPAVPEPEQWALTLAGLGVLGWGMRRR